MKENGITPQLRDPSKDGPMDFEFSAYPKSSKVFASDSQKHHAFELPCISEIGGESRQEIVSRRVVRACVRAPGLVA